MVFVPLSSKIFAASNTVSTSDPVAIKLIVESGEPREVMHFALLLGYGAAAINPYLAYATLDSMLDKKEINVKDLEYAVLNYKKAIHKGLLKIASKMGISTIQSYRGAKYLSA